MGYKYNPRRIALNVHGFPITGFAKGTFVTVEAAEDACTASYDQDGNATLILNPNESATISFVLVQSAPANEFLSARVPSARRNFLSTGDTGLKDLNGTTLVHADLSWLTKVAKIAYGDGEENREWMVACESATIFVGRGGLVLP